MQLDTAAIARTTTSIRRQLSPLNPLYKRPATRVVANATNCTVPLEAKRPSVQPTVLLHLSNLQRVLRDSSLPLPASNAGDGTFTPSLDVNSLDLSDVLPAARNVLEMSPRSLKHLHLVLSDSPKPSPRGNISRRWQHLHGSDDWSSLLDPLDEDLRREVLRYGEHVQAAYHAFHHSHSHSHHVVLPDRTYHVTHHLHATSSIVPPAWLPHQRSSWIGYVAVCDNQREIQRLGRRDIVIALRGTATCLEWAEDLRNVLVPLSDDSMVTEEGCHVASKVECGFLSLFKTTSPEDHQKSLSEDVADEVLRLMKVYSGEQLSITITGHSLGAALALLVADQLSVCATRMPPIAVFSFGGPRVGNRGFAERIRRRGVKVLRVVNEHDVVTRVPGVFASEAMDRKLRDGGDNVTKRILDVLDGHMPWAYSHVGSELRVDSRRSPYLRADADLGCCHDLEAYLHLVDGFLSSYCPFRSNAKRSIVRLMRQQGSEVKKPYTSKKATLDFDGSAAAPVSVPISDRADGYY